MKKWTIIVLVIIISTFGITIGCKRKESTKEEIYKDFQKKIVTMSSYKCTAEVQAIGNKSPGNYTLIHTYSKPDNYKLEVVLPEHLKGKTIEYKKDKILVENPDIKDIIELPNAGENNQYLFIGDFIKNYLQNEEVTIKLTNESLVLGTDIPGGSEYFSKQVLYVNKETKVPERLEILDIEGNQRFVVNYKDFEYKK